MSIEIVYDPNVANVITHGGKFHADEIMATVVLKKIYDDIKICRVDRMPDNYNEDAIVYDIGGGIYDHHQTDAGISQVRVNGVPYAAVGLIWKDFGHQICDTDGLWEEIDRTLIQGIDAVDNKSMPNVDYPVDCMNISKIIGLFNLNWDEQGSNDGAFLEAVAFSEKVFDKVYANASSRLKAEDIVEKAIEESKDHIMVLDYFVPWQEFVFKSSNEKADKIHYVIFPAARGGYNWQCVPDGYGSHQPRKPVPKEWEGLSGEKLQKVTGIPSAVFCHAAGFIGGAETFEDAYKMTELAEQS